MNRYPDMGSTELYDALSARLGVPARPGAATGSVALIYQLVPAFCEPGDEVVYAWRSFEAYPIAVAAAAATSVQVPVTADGRHDLDAMAPRSPTGPGWCWSARPTTRPARPSPRPSSTPSWPRSRRTCWSSSTRRTSSSSAWTTPSTGWRPTARHPNVVLTRTFSKAYGLAGFRVGYAVAPEPLAAALRAVSLPFGVSSVAQAAAVASLAAEPELLERVDALVAERDRVVAGLREVGWEVPEPQGNFVWFGLGDRTADFAAAADEVGIVVRPFAGEGARVSIGEPEANDRLVELAAPVPAPGNVA